MRRDFLICLILAGITLGLYWPTHTFDLVHFDDPLFVTENSEINSGLNWHSLGWACTGIVAANWHPITNFSFLLTHQFYGANPHVEHMVNVAFHAINAVLLFVLLRKLTGRPWRSAAVAAIFAWHPLRVESVAWIAERKDVLCAFFWFLSLIAYSSYAHGKKSSIQEDRSIMAFRKNAYLFALIFFVMALLSKPMAVTLPCTLLLLDAWPFERHTVYPTNSIDSRALSFRTAIRLLVEKWPFFLITIIFCIITFLVQKNGAAVSSVERTGLDTRVANVVMSYLRYLGKMIWPSDLAILYPFPVNERSYLAIWPVWQLIAGALSLLLISIACVRQWSLRPYLAFGWLWFLGTLLPVIGLIQVGGQGMADRYTYLPLIGPTVSCVWFISETFKKSGLKLLLTPSLAAVLLACLFLTSKQLSFWRDTVSLFTHTVNVTGDNFLAQLIIADGYVHQDSLRQALVHARMAIAIYPTDKQGYQMLGRFLEQENLWPAVASAYNSALAIDPNDAESHLGLAEALTNLGKTDEAAAHLETALHLNNDSPEILNNLAWMLATSKEPALHDGPRAVTLALRACELTQYQKTIFVGTLAAAYAEVGKFDDAVATARRACDLARKNGEDDLLQTNLRLLEKYQQHQPAHD